MHNQRMIIVGAGECGTRAAFALREQGYTGEVVLIGDEADYPYERPPLSKQILLEAGEPQPKYIASPEQFTAANIQLLRQQRVTTLDTERHRVSLADAEGNTRELAYDKLLLATGTRPRTLPVPGMDDCRHCAYLRTFADAQRIRSALNRIHHVVIVGGGLIGLELAASARQLGVEVTVLEADSRILRRAVPASIAEVIAQRHALAGAEIYLNAVIESVQTQADTDTLRVQLQDGVNLLTELMVIGIGAIPNVELAVQAGLEVANGIVVDSRLQTSAADVYAAGDCCAFPLARNGRVMRLETWRNAQEQGNLAARNMLGANEASSAVPWFWSDQYDLGLQVAGLSSAENQRVRRQLAEDAFIDFELDTDGRLVAAGGIGPCNTVAKEIRLAEMLIAKGASPAAEALADCSVNLKKLLR
ncbi:MAG: FAD-dependent oxidoreductase [Thiolinea sp.]